MNHIYEYNKGHKLKISLNPNNRDRGVSPSFIGSQMYPGTYKTYKVIPNRVGVFNPFSILDGESNNTSISISKDLYPSETVNIILKPEVIKSFEFKIIKTNQPLDITLDLDNPNDYIKYLIAMQYPNDFTFNPQDSLHIFVIEDMNIKSKNIVSMNVKTIDVNTYFSDIKTNKFKLMLLIKGVDNRNSVSNNMSTDDMFTKAYQIANNKINSTHRYIKDEDKKIVDMINAADISGLINYNKQRYWLDNKPFTYDEIFSLLKDSEGAETINKEADIKRYQYLKDINDRFRNSYKATMKDYGSN